MTSPIARLRYHGQHSERQKPAPAPARPAVAGSRIPAGPQGTLKVPAGTAAAEPVTTVRCEFCKVLGPSSLIPDIGRGPRCADTDACVRRWADGGIPAPLPGAGHDAAAYYTPMPGAGKAIERRFAGPDAEPPAALPEAQERALGDFLAAHDEEDALTAEAAPESGEDTPAETSPDADPCPIEVWLHPDRFPCQLAR